jgi:DNA-binding NarL/FixJ family response regulator
MLLAVFSYESISEKIEARFIRFGASGMLNFRYDTEAKTVGLETVIRAHEYITPRLVEGGKGFEYTLADNIALTKREYAIYEYLIYGVRQTEIAKRLHRSVHTVRHQVQSIYKKAGVNSN